MLVHSSLKILSKSFRFWSWCWASGSFSSLHRSSMGLRSGDWLGPLSTICSSSLATPVLPWPYVQGHCPAGRPLHDPCSVSWLREGGYRPRCYGTWPRPSSPRCRSSCPLSRETPPKQNVSTSMLDGGDGVLGVIVSISLPPNTACRVDAKDCDFGLIWPHHLLPSLLWIIQMFIVELQTGLSCSSWAGDLAGAAGFDPLWCSVLPIVLLGLWSQLPWDH